ncbi:MAG: CHASE domain-containing protein, partial [Deltaproteobacteria bacterium]|nr:CHASE domain-containing protein [Deltaproteobacteria bacterium]
MSGDMKKNRISSIHRYIQLALTLIIGIALTLMAFVVVRNREMNLVEMELQRLAGNLTTALQKNTDNYVEVLRSIARLYAATNKIEREEFHYFVRYALWRYPGIRALAWAPRVPYTERRAYEEKARSEGFSVYQITERDSRGRLIRAGRRDEYFPGFYVEPLEGNYTALGLDMASDPILLEAMEKARDTGDAVSTGRITLVYYDAEQYGFMVFMPIYRRGALLGTVDERRTNLSGFAVGVFRIEAVVNHSIAGMDTTGVEFHIYAGASTAAGSKLYTSQIYSPKGLPPLDKSGMHTIKTIKVAGRTWTILFQPTAEFIASHKFWQSLGVLAGGLTITALLGFYLVISMGHTATLQKEIAERKQAEEQLVKAIDKANNFAILAELESTRLRSMIEGMEEGVVMADDEDRIIEINSWFLRAIGKSKKEIIGKSLWDFHGGDVARKVQAIIESFRTRKRTTGVVIERELLGLWVSLRVQPIFSEKA